MFKFLHAADIHLDSPFKGLERYEGAPAEKMRQATRRALENLVQLALDEQVKFVLIAGDLLGAAAFAGIAETGTLALVSGPDNPTTLNFLPDNHIVLLPREAIEADYESVFAKVRSVYGKGEAPRTLNFITGPSRSADIEQTLLLGAHGPRRLHIVVVG